MKNISELSRKNFLWFPLCSFSRLKSKYPLRFFIKFLKKSREVNFYLSPPLRFFYKIIFSEGDNTLPYPVFIFYAQFMHNLSDLIMRAIHINNFSNISYFHFAIFKKCIFERGCFFFACFAPENMNNFFTFLFDE